MFPISKNKLSYDSSSGFYNNYSALVWNYCAENSHLIKLFSKQSTSKNYN